MSISRDFASLANQDVSAAEFDKLDGVTASTVELNVVTGGITSLGAVTAGTLGSNVVFPAGHMVGFGKAVGTGNPSGGNSATSYEQMDNAIITYSPKVTGNILLFNASISCYLDTRSTDAYFTWYAGSANIADTATGSGGMGLSRDNLVHVHEYGGSANDDFPIGGDVTGWWTAQNTNSTAFSVYWKSGVATEYHVIVCTLMEIQQ